MNETIRPRTIDEALTARAEYPGAILLAGGTDLMVEINFARRRPERIIDLTPVRELDVWSVTGDDVRIGAGVTHARIVAELGGVLPGLAIAARTVGSPQIRNRGTLGGNLATASPAGDAIPPLVASGARIELASTRGTRVVPIEAFYTGPKRSTIAADELITAAIVPRVRGAQQFAKVGTRNAMVIAVCSFALDLDPASGRVGTAIGSAAPTVVRAPEAEAFAATLLADGSIWDPGGLRTGDAERFGELAAAAARPIDDVRGTSAYRRHALAVLAARTLTWAVADLRGSR